MNAPETRTPPGSGAVGEAAMRVAAGPTEGGAAAVSTAPAAPPSLPAPHIWTLLGFLGDALRAAVTEGNVDDFYLAPMWKPRLVILWYETGASSWLHYDACAQGTAFVRFGGAS